MCLWNWPAYEIDNVGNVQAVYHTDGLGSVRALTDANGNLIQTYQSDPFGVPTQTQGSSTQPFGFTGQQQDAESSFDYLRARYYDPSLGRFLSRDTVFGSSADPLSLNLYTYAQNSPTNLTDPNGHCFDLEECSWELGGEVLAYAAAAAAVQAQQYQRVTVSDVLQDSYGGQRLTNTLNTARLISTLIVAGDRALAQTIIDQADARINPTGDDTPPVGRLRNFSPRLLDWLGGEDYTAPLKEKSGKSRSDLKYDPKTGRVYTVPKQKGLGGPEYVDDLPEGWQNHQ